MDAVSARDVLFGHAFINEKPGNVVEFRHASWWNETVYAAFRKSDTIFCSCSAPRLPDMLVRTADEVYVRLHGLKHWYRHDYTREELSTLIDRISASGATRAWVYFNNDYQAFAPQNAMLMRRLMGRRNKGSLTSKMLSGG